MYNREEIDRNQTISLLEYHEEKWTKYLAELRKCTSKPDSRLREIKLSRVKKHERMVSEIKKLMGTARAC